jgi:hypothetical protein
MPVLYLLSKSTSKTTFLSKRHKLKWSGEKLKKEIFSDWKNFVEFYAAASPGD